MKDCGVELKERAVRYHLKLTELVQRRHGRLLTEHGIEEVECALVQDKAGFAISRIELLAFRTDFDDNRYGSTPVNVSFFAKQKFSQPLRAMKPAFEEGFYVSDHAMSTLMEYQDLVKFQEL